MLLLLLLPLLPLASARVVVDARSARPAATAVGGQHQLAQQLDEARGGGGDSVEQVHDGRRHLELLLAAGLIAASRRGLLLRDYRNLEPLLEVLQKLLAQFLAEHIAEQLGQEGQPLDQVWIQAGPKGILVL